MKKPISKGFVKIIVWSFVISSFAFSKNYSNIADFKLDEIFGIQSFQITNSEVIKNYDPLLVIVLMVKNEAGVMRDTLQPFVDIPANDTSVTSVNDTSVNDTCVNDTRIVDLRKHIAFLIFDTGSTDSTMAVTKQYFEEKGVHNAVIKQEPFVDFATSRTRALQLAQEAFPNACFMFMPDAEWYMHNVEGLVQFCQLHKNDTCPSYLVRIMNNYSDFYTRRLIRCHSGVRFVGDVHEELNLSTGEKIPQDCFFWWSPRAAGIEASQRRWSRDLEKLLKSYERNPQDPRTVFYIPN